MGAPVARRLKNYWENETSAQSPAPTRTPPIGEKYLKSSLDHARARWLNEPDLINKFFEWSGRNDDKQQRKAEKAERKRSRT